MTRSPQGTGISVRVGVEERANKGDGPGTSTCAMGRRGAQQQKSLRLFKAEKGVNYGRMAKSNVCSQGGDTGKKKGPSTPHTTRGEAPV